MLYKLKQLDTYDDGKVDEGSGEEKETNNSSGFIGHQDFAYTYHISNIHVHSDNEYYIKHAGCVLPFLE